MMDSYVTEKNLKRSEDLYGVGGKHFEEMTYKTALEEKIKLAKKLVGELVEVPFMKQESDRIHRCLNAVDFNQKLLKEMKEEI